MLIWNEKGEKNPVFLIKNIQICRPETEIRSAEIMVAKIQLEGFKYWFEEYTVKLIETNTDVKDSLLMKKEHTLRVCKEIKQIGLSLHLTKNCMRIAQITALFHDIGRFEQFIKYRTFSDQKSEDHAELGIRILKNHDVLNSLTDEEIEIIYKSIRYHNKKDLPVHENENVLFFTKLLRDADKLDIYHVVTDQYKDVANENNEAIMLDLPKAGKISDKIVESIRAGAICNLPEVKSQEDFKLLQISWVYDINFLRTYQLIRERGYLKLIYESMPQISEINEIRDIIKRYIDNQCVINNFEVPADLPVDLN